MNYATARIEKAAECLAGKHYRRALVELDQAVWNLSPTNSDEDVARLEALLDEVARSAPGRQANEAERLRVETGRRLARIRRLTAIGERALPPDPGYESSHSVSILEWVLGGAVGGAVIGGILGTASSSGAMPDLGGFLGAIVGVPIGIVLALLVAAVSRS
jgi:hypothetical protein